MFFLLAAGIALLSGFDGYLSYRRMQTYGYTVELNPVAKQFCQNYGPKAGAGFVLGYNLLLLGLCVYVKAPLLVGSIFGFKLATCAYQLRSVQIENRIVSIFLANQRKKLTPAPPA